MNRGVRTDEAVGRRGRLRPRGVFWLSFGALWFIAGLWALASPLMAGLDEPAHAIKAAAVVRGELIGTPYVDPAATEQERAQQGGRATVAVTALFEQLPDLPYCFAFQSDQPAFCQPGLTPDPDAPLAAVTSASRYNPLYYAIVGLPSLLPGSPAALYLMRLVSALLAAGLLAAGLRTLAEVRRPGWLLTAALLTITPMVVFLCSTVNPQSVELAGGFTVWAVTLTLLRDPDPALLVRRLARLTVATVFFVNSRGLSPLFLAIILVVAVVSSPWRSLVAVVTDRRSWPFMAGCAAATAAALGWIRYAGSLDTPAVVALPQYADTETILKLTINNTSSYLLQMLGIFGWLDTPLPQWTYLLLAGALCFLVLAGMALGRWPDRVAVLALAAVVLVFPVLSHYLQSRYIGIFWQGRYMLPIAFGVPLIAGFALRSGGREIPVWISRRLAGVLIATVVVLQTVAYAVNLHRYVNGWQGSWFQLADNSWRPPLHPLLLTGLALLGWLVLVGVVRRADAGSDTGSAAGPDTGSAADSDAGPDAGSAADLGAGPDAATPSQPLTTAAPSRPAAPGAQSVTSR